MRSIKPTALKSELKANCLAGLPSMIWGAPGAGKSEIVYQVAASINAVVCELRANLFDPVDVRGVPKVLEQTDGTLRTKYGVPEEYPASDYQGHVIIFIDELSTAPKATQNCLLQLLTTGKVGTYTCPPNTSFIAAGNRLQDRAAVHEMPTPVKTRFNHYELEADIDDWCAWAYDNDIDNSIISFLRFRPGLLSAVNASENASPTPRGWTYASRKIPFMADEFYGIASLVGDGPAGEYLAFKSVYSDLPEFKDILDKPTTTKVSDDVSVLYAVVGLIVTNTDKTNFSKVVKYIQRMPPEYQVVAMRDLAAKDRTILQEKPFTEWAAANADVFL
ncbi:MAG: AAA family ATPase [Vibrio toranzoniae]|uniref:AAA family ATPase n=1 Tax=Vibrio toranzoniae TaxID=1194427 RepID=UPI003C373F4D